MGRGTHLSVWLKAAAMNLLKDWKKALVNGQGNITSAETNTRQWSKPPQGYIKVYVDAVIFSAIGYTSIGSIIRDEHESFV